MPHHFDAAVLTRLDQFVVTTARSRSKDDRELPALLGWLVAGALETMPDAWAAGILELSPRGAISHHTSDPVVDELDDIARQRHQGPVVAAAAHSLPPAVMHSTLDAEAAARWPEWACRARAAGVAATLTLALPVTAGKRPTLLTFYAQHPGRFDQTSVAAAQSFAAPITVTLQAIDQTQALQRAVESRDVIGQAKGTLMERHRLRAEDAFAGLVRISQETNVRLAEVAACLVGEGTTTTTARPSRHPRTVDTPGAKWRDRGVSRAERAGHGVSGSPPVDRPARANPVS